MNIKMTKKKLKEYEMLRNSNQNKKAISVLSKLVGNFVNDFNAEAVNYSINFFRENKHLLDIKEMLQYAETLDPKIRFKTEIYLVTILSSIKKNLKINYGLITEILGEKFVLAFKKMKK